MISQFDYIISGAGCAGFSLLYRILQEPSLQDKKILVIDSVEKNSNDRTWCFWEKEKGLFDEIVFHHWDELAFQSNDFSRTFSIAPYSYKMIRGIDFYDHVLAIAKTKSNVKFVQEKVVGVESRSNEALVVTEQNKYAANFVFNSIVFNKPVGQYNLLQHFKGWVIETEEDVFDPLQATFMDFSVEQNNGTTFMYVLPTSTRTALVEYTLFTETVLANEEYDSALRNYIQSGLKIESFKIVHEEFGVIPMTDFDFPSQEKNIIHIGTAGGQTKASSGYTFQFIQKQTATIVERLVNNNSMLISKTFNEKKFKLYDKVLLNVLCNKKMNGADVFTSIFQKNKPQLVLKFLDNETSLLEDLKILASVPTKVFLPAAIKEMLH